FDFWSDRTLPPKITLTLNGARTVRVHAIDSRGRPVSGINVVPWVLTKQGRTDSANLSGFKSQFEGAQTDADGLATIDWLPVDLGQRLTFLADSNDFHLPWPPSLEPGPKDAVVDLEMQLLQTTKISGTVYTAEGNPAAGIVLQAEGRGDTNHYF